MRQYLLKMKSYFNEKMICNRFLCFKVGCILIVASLFASLPITTVKAATGLKIYDYSTKQQSTYTGKQIKVTLNGKQIIASHTPGILVNGAALVSYKDLFSDSINADCVYKSSKGTITISLNGTTIGMTINSKKATVNGKAVTLVAAPMKIKYTDSNVIKILVPSRFVSEALGLTYTWDSNRNTVAIKNSTLQLSYNSDKKFEYKGTQGLVSIDGTKINLGNMPSVITNNTAMLRAKKVFADTKIAAQYQFDSSSNTVKLSKNGTEVLMTIGSPVAYVNGNPMMLDTAPIIVHNYNSNTSYVMVPGGFTASCLGYDYTWNNTARTSMITSRKDETSSTGGNSNGGSNNSPELGGGGSVNENAQILNQWPAIDSLFGKSSNLHELNTEVVSSNTTGFVNYVTRDFSNGKPNSETFLFVSSTPFEKITSNISGKMISIITSNKSCNDQTYQMYGVNSNYINTLSTTYVNESNSTTIGFDALTENITYDLTLSEDKLILYVTVYSNSLTSATVSTGNAGDYLTMTGLTALKPVISEDGGYLYIDLPYTTNGIGDIYAEALGTKFINRIYTLGLADKTRIIMQLTDGYEYYISEDGNQYTVSFLSLKGSTQPQPQPQPQPETPVVIDKNNYEIVIPRPVGISNEQISHVDYYYNNKFAIKIAGDYTAFFANNPVTWGTDVIKDVSISLNSNYETEILFSTTRLQGYRFVADNDKIYVHIGEPREIYKNIVVLDCGHGGPANGAVYFNTNEKDINFMILYIIGKKYFDSDPTNLKVYYTRSSDVDMTLSNRASFASKVGADLFVSLHMNASTAAYAYGTEVYYSEKNNNTNSAGLTSKALGTLMLNNITGTLGTDNRGVKSERYTVVHSNTVPAILIELGFISNKNDYAKITDPAFQENAVRVIYETIRQVFDVYPTGR